MKKSSCVRKKILLISNMYPSKRFPHYGIFVKNTAEMLRENGFQVDCIAIKKQKNKFVKLRAYVSFHLKIMFYVIAGKYDCVYAHYISHTAFALLMIKKICPEIKIVANVHGNDIVPEDEHDKKYLPLVKKVSGKVSQWIVPSEYFKHILEKQYGISAAKIIVYPSGGINRKIFTPKDKRMSRKQLGLSEEDFIVGYVGRIEKDKGWDTLVVALSHLKEDYAELKCILVGSGDFEKELEKLIEDRHVQDRIIRMPLIPQKELVTVYNALDIFCLPSFRKSESLALAGLEAMSCGCIVLGSNMAGPATYINNGVNGFLFEPQNDWDLSDKIECIRKCTMEELEKICRQAKQTAEKYDKERVKGHLIQVFENL